MIKLTDKHSQSFFGQAVGLTIQSSSKSDPFIFLKCIKKKPDNSWEKPSLGEGKAIKCSFLFHHSLIDLAGNVIPFEYIFK